MPVDFGIRCEFCGNTRAYDFVLALIGGGVEARGFRREWAFIF